MKKYKERPRKGDWYYHVSLKDNEVYGYMWNGSTSDEKLFNSDRGFNTGEEAEEYKKTNI